MVRFVLGSRWLRLAPLALVPGCLVSFNDYPLGATDSEGGSASSGASAGGSGGNASAGAGATSGSSTGGKASAGSGSLNEAGDAPAAGGADPTGTELGSMIDDFEDGNAAILGRDGRDGAWYAGNDGQGMQTPPDQAPLEPTELTQPRGDSTQAAHTFGGPFQSWGALIGTSLASDGDSDVPYDVRAYEGIRFWVRSPSFAANAAKEVRFNLPTLQTNSGGGCFVCNDHFGVDIPLTSQWTEHEVRFADLEQDGFGMPRLQSPNLQQVTAVQFFFTKDLSFDLWVDDVEFF